MSAGDAIEIAHQVHLLLKSGGGLAGCRLPQDEVIGIGMAQALTGMRLGWMLQEILLSDSPEEKLAAAIGVAWAEGFHTGALYADGHPE